MKRTVFLIFLCGVVMHQIKSMNRDAIPTLADIIYLAQEIKKEPYNLKELISELLASLAQIKLKKLKQEERDYVKKLKKKYYKKQTELNEQAEYNSCNAPQRSEERRVRISPSAFQALLEPSAETPIKSARSCPAIAPLDHSIAHSVLQIDSSPPQQKHPQAKSLRIQAIQRAYAARQELTQLTARHVELSSDTQSSLHRTKAAHPLTMPRTDAPPPAQQALTNPLAHKPPLPPRRGAPNNQQPPPA